MQGEKHADPYPRLPQRPDAERALLGAVLRDNVVLQSIGRIVSASDFFVAAHRRIFVAMLQLAMRSQIVEEISLFEDLRTDSEVTDVGGIAFIAALADGIPQNAPVVHWAEMVRDASTLRRIASAGQAITTAALYPDAKAEEVAQHAQSLIKSLATPLAGNVSGTLASEVEPEHVQWLWKERVPLGKVTVMDGDPGLGKSALSLDLAARVSTGGPMPDGSQGVEGGVLILNAEDGTADTIVPRLATMGANLELIRILKTLPSLEGERQPEIPGDLPAIERAAQSVGARLIVIDPLMAYLPQRTNSWRDQDVRRALAPLATMAERIGVAILIVRHLNKSAEGNPLYRGGGSIGIIGAARSGLLVAPDPDDEQGAGRILAVSKANLALCPSSLRYSIEPHAGSIRVCWHGESTYRAAALLAKSNTDEDRTAVEEAAEFLRSFLEDNPAAAVEVRRKAQGLGFKDHTLVRAKARIGVKARHDGFGKGSKWIWELPAKDPNTAPKNANCQEVASFEEPVDSKPVESNGSHKNAKLGGSASFGSSREECGRSAKTLVEEIEP